LLVLRAARDAGVKHMIVTHGASTWPLADLQEAVKLGAFIEARAGFDLLAEPKGPLDPRKATTDVIRQIGPEHIVMVSDLGQRANPVHPDGLAIAARWLRSQGFTDQQLNLMFKDNPARLMGLPVQ
jgi:predicted metal-dependent phosphotriesterase family hydrolase